MRPDERFLVPKMRFILGTAGRVNLAVLIVVAVLLGARPAAAQGCEAVVDETGLVDVAEVQQALTELDGQADAKVYVFQSVSNNDIDTAVDDLIARCFSDGPAGRQADLILIAVSIDDRLTSLEYGFSHNVELGEVIDVIDGVDVTRADEIRDDVINTRFAAGDITGGIVDGLAALDDSIGPLDTGSGDTGSGEAGAVDPDGAATGGADGSSSSATPSEPDAGFPWGVALVGGGVTVGGAGLLVSRRRKLIAERNTLESESQQPRIAVGVGRERSARLMAQAGVWERLVLGGTLEDLLERVADGRQAASDTERAVALFDQAIPRGIAEAKSGEVAVATARLRELEASLERFNEALDRIEFFGARIDRLRVTLPRKREQLTTEIDQSLQLATEREAAGWKVAQPQQRLANAREQLAALDFDPLQVDLVELSLVVEAGEAELFAARHDLQTLDDTVESLQTWADQLAAGEKMERDRIEETRGALAGIARQHAPESWRWAGDHLDGASVSLDHAASSRLRSTDVHLPAQDWDDAGKALEAAGLELIRSDDLLDEVDSLLVSLDTAKEHAAAVLAQAGTQVDSLRSFVGKHDEDLPARFDVEPNDADAAIAGLRAELDKELPNYLRVAQTGDRLARQLDALFGEARDEQARVEALRREIERERARAFREIERAEKAIGWELLQSRNGKDLDNLKRELSERSASLEIELRSVQSIADQAVEIRSDVIARRRRDSTWIVAGSSGGGFGVGGSSGGGGGFGGGGFGGGGGSGGGGSFGGGGGSSSW